MFIRKVGMFLALCALAVGFAASAQAATSVEDSNGTLLTSANNIVGTLKSGTTADLSTGIGTISCTAASFAGNLDASSGNGTATNVTGKLKSGSAGLSFTGCTGTGFAAGVTHCDQSGQAPITAMGTSASGGTLTVGSGGTLTVNCSNNFFTVCSVTTTATGAVGLATNSNNTVDFTTSNTPVSGSCGNGSFMGTFSPVTNQTTGHPVNLTGP